ncbi:MAG: lamin tail domain-containing protein [Sandaracinaceae bacterium]|nr:lamin tail domain-containing protein [Sandaracinaceae bacterium]
MRALHSIVVASLLWSCGGGPSPPDSGMDAGAADGGRDAGRPDAGPPHAGPPDAGPPDAGLDAGPDGGTADAAAPDGGAIAIVVNELQPQGDDFAEILNAGSSPLSLDGLFVADMDGIGNPPADPTHRTAVPSGIELAAGERFVIAMNLGSATMPGLLTDPLLCRGASRCIQTSYGMSAGNGDSCAVLDAGGEVIARGDYPGSIAMLGAGESWCRLPDGTGGFARCVATPEAVNQAP